MVINHVTPAPGFCNLTQPSRSVPTWNSTATTLLRLYRTMTTIRHFEERGVPETGQRGMSASVHSSVGQEAVPTGVCAHLSDDDYIGSTHRAPRPLHRQGR